MSEEAPEATVDRAEAAIDQATNAIEVAANQLDELAGDSVAGDAIGIDHLMDVPVRVTVEVGRARMPLAQLVELRPGSVLQLDREAHEPADILVNGKVVARGEIVTVAGNYGVRITSVREQG